MFDDNEEILFITWKTLKRIMAAIVIVALLIHIKNQTIDFVDSYEQGYTYNLRTGQIHRLNRTGYIFHEYWFVEVHTIDLRPMQVCINANQRVLNCKLVKFNPAGLNLFLSWHGRQTYGQDILSEILKSYAYEGAGHTYPFLTIVREMNTVDSTEANTNSGN